MALKTNSQAWQELLATFRYIRAFASAREIIDIGKAVYISLFSTMPLIIFDQE
jgi:hypothetical protein